MKDFDLDAQLRKTLHECADDMKADDNLKARIDFMVNSSNTKGKKAVWKKVTVGLAAALCLTTVGAFARGQLSMLVSSVNPNEMTTSLSELQKQTGTVAEGIQVPEELGGLPFQKGTILYTDKIDDAGNRIGTYPEVKADYGTSINEDGTVLNYSARAYDEELDGEAANPGQSYEGQPKETREIGGVTVSYQADRYIFLPPDAEPTAEEAALEAKGELYISYGSSEREEMTHQHVSWQVDGVEYRLYTMDDSMTADELFAAAADALDA